MTFFCLACRITYWYEAGRMKEAVKAHREKNPQNHPPENLTGPVNPA